MHQGHLSGLGCRAGSLAWEPDLPLWTIFLVHAGIIDEGAFATGKIKWRR